MIIDGHTHGYHGKHLDRLADTGGDWAAKRIAVELRVAKERPQRFDVAYRVEQLDRFGFDLQVVTPGHHLDANLCPAKAPAKLVYAKALNDNMARLMEDSGGRLLTVASIPLESFERGGQEEMERAIGTLGLKAVMLPSHIDGKPIDLPEYEPFWAQAAQMDVAVYIHPRDPITDKGRSYEADYDLIHLFGWPFETVLALTRLVFSGVMERYPTLKVVSHHLGGGMVPFFLGRIFETYEPQNQEKLIGKVLPKPLGDYFSSFYYDTAVGGSPAAIRCAYEEFGADRLVFATDAPNGPKGGESRLANYPGVIRSLGLSEAENEKIFSGNIRKVLNLE